jgi:hypothetical protein
MFLFDLNVHLKRNSIPLKSNVIVKAEIEPEVASRRSPRDNIFHVCRQQRISFVIGLNLHFLHEFDLRFMLTRNSLSYYKPRRLIGSTICLAKGGVTISYYLVGCRNFNVVICLLP